MTGRHAPRLRPDRSIRIRTAALLVSLACLAFAPHLEAQALSGLVRLAPSGTPAGQTVVLAVTEAARIVAAARTDAGGVFAMYLGQPGSYHLVFVRARSAPITTPDFVLDTTPAIERVFEIPGDSAMGSASSGPRRASSARCKASSSRGQTRARIP